MKQLKKYSIKNLDFKLCQIKALASFNKFEGVARSKKEKQTPNKFISCLVGSLGEYATKIHIEKSMLQQRAEVISTSNNKPNEFEKQDIEVKFLDENNERRTYKIEVKSQQIGYARCQILTYHADKYYKNAIDFVVFAEVNFEKELFKMTKKEFENINDVLFIAVDDEKTLSKKLETDIIEVEKLLSAEVEIYAIERPKNFFNHDKYEIHLNKFKYKTYIRKDCVSMLSSWQILNQNEFIKKENEILKVF